MARREVIECDSCGVVCKSPAHWRVTQDPIEYVLNEWDFCSRACLIKHLGGDVLVHYERLPSNGFIVKVGSFAWAMQRVKDGAEVRMMGHPQMLAVSRAALDKRHYGTIGAVQLLGWLDAEWVEVH